MQRKDFLKQSVLAGISLSVFGKPSDNGAPCTETPEETEGPFSTHKPETLVTQNIIADRVGTPLQIDIKINNINDNCLGLKGAIVDIWHCDSKGEYSEYGGNQEQGNGGGPGGMRMPPPGMKSPPDSGMKKMGNQPPRMGGRSMQPADHTKEHFLRGRQTTNVKGLVSFHSIFPGWYSGRAPHIHVQVFSASGKSLLVTQIAFPEDITTKVYTQGVYSVHDLPETPNAADNVFNDGIANELAVITGNTTDGFILSHSVYVKAG